MLFSHAWSLIPSLTKHIVNEMEFNGSKTKTYKTAQVWMLSQGCVCLNERAYCSVTHRYGNLARLTRMWLKNVPYKESTLQHNCILMQWASTFVLYFCDFVPIRWGLLVMCFFVVWWEALLKYNECVYVHVCVCVCLCV